jgi:hypothetical protein
MSLWHYLAKESSFKYIATSYKYDGPMLGNFFYGGQASPFVRTGVI